ncbi:unnamed protein product, partial [Urochloa humidicola]
SLPNQADPPHTSRAHAKPPPQDPKDPSREANTTRAALASRGGGGAAALRSSANRPSLRFERVCQGICGVRGGIWRGVVLVDETMVGFAGKRKELERVVDGLSDFSLSGPAAKSRRMDPGLPPIMEEEPPSPSMAFQMLGEEINGGVNMPGLEVVMESAMSHHTPSEDKALVLYKPVDNSVAFGPGISSSSFIVSSDLIRGLKSHAFNQVNYHELEDESPERSNSLALVPWKPPQMAIRSDWVASEPESARTFEVPMEADETEVTSMDFEEAPEATARGFDDDNIHQWQHCMTLPSLPNPSAHVMWSR